MTQELKQAAQQAIEALDEIHAGKRHPQLALAVAHNLRRALNQRPAAQTERGLFEELWAKPNNVHLTLDVNQRNYHYPQAKAGWSAWKARASLPASQQATPEPVGEPVAYREKLTGRLCEPEHTHRRKFPMCYEPLFTHPASGVPDEVQRNARRYVWLRDKSVPPHNFYLSVPDEFDGVRYTPAEVDAYIDAALAAAQAKK